MLSRLLRALQQNEETAEDHAQLLPLSAAALLLEVAWADHEIADHELALIERQLKQTFRLGDDDVAELVAESKRAHEDSVGLYGYTRTINDQWDEPRKFELITTLWRLALSDDELHRYEEHTIRKIAELLYVSHARFIEAKLTAKRDAESG
ncbi:MAG: TerB family tellurite resistance protein [Pseudomonadales bacterium]